MPVSGLPDPDEHWHCMSCEQWFGADDGQLFEKQRFSYAAKIADSIRGGAPLRFRCFACTEKHRRNRLLFWGLLAAIVAFAMAWQLWQESRFRL